MGSGYSDLSATGATPEMAIGRLMDKIGHENYAFCYGTVLEFRETSDGFYETNLTIRGGYLSGGVRRAEINRLWNAKREEYYYRAWFGLLC